MMARARARRVYNPTAHIRNACAWRGGPTRRGIQMPDDMIIRFWGVRGSYPVPGPRTMRFGGNTACVEVQAGVHTIILDAGTGIINLGGDLLRRARSDGNRPVVATILFSHMHNDHTV